MRCLGNFFHPLSIEPLLLIAANLYHMNMFSGHIHHEVFSADLQSQCLALGNDSEGHNLILLILACSISQSNSTSIASACIPSKVVISNPLSISEQTQSEMLKWRGQVASVLAKANWVQIKLQSTCMLMKSMPIKWIKYTSMRVGFWRSKQHTHPPWSDINTCFSVLLK